MFVENYRKSSFNYHQILSLPVSLDCRFIEYHSDPKYSDRQVLANRVDPDKIAPEGAVGSGSTLFAILSPFSDAYVCGKAKVFKF